MYPKFALLLLLLVPHFALYGQETKPKDVREMAKSGSSAIPRLQPLLKNADLNVRLEVVKALTEIGTQRSLDPLLEATLDSDAEVQMRATDGLINFYLPGYVRYGVAASIRRAGGNIRSKFSDTNDHVIDPYVQVRPDVIAALGKLAHGGVTMDVRANAARAVGILRGQAAVPDLLEAMRTKDSAVLYESLVALQKIRDKSVAPKLRYLLRDLDEKVQLAAIETTGLLQNPEALPDLVDALNRARGQKVRRAALTAIAMIPDESSRSLYTRYLTDKDEALRAAAAEGFARLKKPADKPMLEKAYEDEQKTSPRLSVAFALVALGKTEVSEFSPLQFLVNGLNSKARQGEAQAFLIELARDPAVRTLLYPALTAGTKDEKVRLAQIMARSGDKDSLSALERVSQDGDSEVAAEGLRALRSLRARL
ncbi:MAG: HEAT repeat domain-containing protein [Bryobacteraceae bacterium]